MPDDRLRAGRDEAGCGVDGLARVAAVIGELDREALAADAAGGVDVVDRRLHAAAQLLAQRRIGP